MRFETSLRSPNGGRRVRSAERANSDVIHGPACRRFPRSRPRGAASLCSKTVELESCLGELPVAELQRAYLNPGQKKSRQSPARSGERLRSCNAKKSGHRRCPQCSASWGKSGRFPASCGTRGAPAAGSPCVSCRPFRRGPRYRGLRARRLRSRACRPSGPRS